MTREDLILIHVMEECSEVEQRVSKALHFGMDQIQENRDDKPEQNPERLNNRERILVEFHDLYTLMIMAGFHQGELIPLAYEMAKKMDKVNKYLGLADRSGRLDG